jgi:hypothetical protein
MYRFIYFWVLNDAVIYWGYLLLNGRVIAAELWTEKGIEGSCHGLFEAQYWNFVEVLRKTTIVGVWTHILTQHLSNAKQNHPRPFIISHSISSLFHVFRTLWETVDSLNIHAETDAWLELISNPQPACLFT